MADDCPFCTPDTSDILLSGKSWYARVDKYPVAPGHSLLIPRRHFADLFEATSEELDETWALIRDLKQMLVERHQPDGFNIGVNVGAAAGQTVFHVHIHVIPRYAGDVEDPRGGVRGVIPAKQKY